MNDPLKSTILSYTSLLDVSSNYVLDISSNSLLDVSSISLLDVSSNSLTNINNKTSIINLSELLLTKVSGPSYNLSKDQIEWINLFIKSAPPNTFENIIQDIQKITTDGKINIQDIPSIIKLFADIYSSTAFKSNIHNPQNIIIFIKFTLDVILESDLVLLPNCEVKLIEYIVNSSLDLLSMNLPTKIKCCFF